MARLYNHPAVEDNLYNVRNKAAANILLDEKIAIDLNFWTGMSQY